MTVREACKFAGFSRTELYRRIGAGELAFAKQGRRTLIPRRALVRLLAARVSSLPGEDAAR